MSSNLVLTYVGGKRIQHTIAPTAGNVIYNASPATGKRWLIFRARVNMVTDATVADRYMSFQTTDGTNITGHIGQCKKQIASQTELTSIAETITVAGGTLTGLGCVNYFGLARPILIEEADQFRITVSFGVAGDSYSGTLIALEL